MCCSKVSWHQTWKVLLHVSARLSEAHHTVTLLSSTKNHPLTLAKQATELLTAKQQHLQDFKPPYQGNSHRDLQLGHAEDTFSSSSTYKCHPC